MEQLVKPQARDKVFDSEFVWNQGFWFWFSSGIKQH